MALNEYSRAAVYSVPEIINLPEFKDQGFLHAVALRAFKSAGMVKQAPGAKQLLATVVTNRATTKIVTNPISSTYLDLTTSGEGDGIADFMSNAKYNWWMKYGRIEIPLRDLQELQNEPQSLRAYIRNVMEVFSRSWSRAIEDDLFGAQPAGHIDPLSGGSANKPWGDTDRPANILYWIDAPAGANNTYYPYGTGDPTSQTSAGTWKPPGDIDRSASVNAWWNCVHVRPSSSEALTVQKLLYPITLVSAGGETEPDLVFVNPYVYSWLQGIVAGAQQWVDVATVGDVAFGFSAIRLGHAMVIPFERFNHISGLNASNGQSATASKNTILYINSKDLAIYASDSVTAEPVELPHPIKFWKVTGYFALWADSMRAHARYTNWYI